MGKLKEKFKVIFISSFCLGCCGKPRSMIAVDQPSKGMKIHGKTINKISISEGSLRSVSSMSTSNPAIDLHTGSSTSNTIEFVNNGLLLWNQTRQQWSTKECSPKPKQVQEYKLSSSAAYDSLIGTDKPFPHHIPLSEMVDFLIDVWEQEGLYD